MTINMNFNSAFNFVMKWEGGEVNDPDDPGGHTKYGISQKAYPYVDIKSLTKQDAMDIYESDYWLRSKADKLPESLRLAHFDAAVNTGVNRANKLLQKALKVESDGIIGVKTLKAAHSQGGDVLPSMLAYRALFYVGLVTRKPTLSKFLFGWFRRIFDIAINS